MSAPEKPANGEVWEHVRSGGRYLIWGEVYNSVTDQVDVLYRPMYECEWPCFTRQLEGHPKAFLSLTEDGQPRFRRVA